MDARKACIGLMVLLVLAVAADSARVGEQSIKPQESRDDCIRECGVQCTGIGGLDPGCLNSCVAACPPSV